MSCGNEVALILRQAGQKITPQRVLILSAVKHAAGHVSAGDVLAAVRESYPYVDASTVYRALTSARQSNLVSEIHLPADDTRFEWIGSSAPHHHLVCEVCGEVSSLQNELIEPLVTVILQETGFAAEMEHMSIRGVCQTCRPQSRTAEP